MSIARSLFTLLLLCLASVQAQTLAVVVPDSGKTDTSVVATDSTLIADSLRKNETGVDTLVFYSAEDINFLVPGRITVLSGNASISYKEMKLEAGEIIVDWDKQILQAKAIADTLYLDTTKTEIDTIFMRGLPHFKQGEEEFNGDEIAYNMKTKIGRVKNGTTIYDDGHYRGELFKRISSRTLVARNGEFTSCDKECPDYHFSANRLKVQVGKRVLARPVFLYFDDVPVLAFPYGIFPNQKGRTSGIITPIYGESGTQGRFLRNIGYYWAPSDYLDLRTSIDYFEKLGFLGGTEFRYNKRYVMNGNSLITFNTQRESTGASKRNYHAVVNHTHTIDRNTTLRVSGSYTSDESFNKNFGTTQQWLTQTVSSNATLNKSWDNSPWTLSANLGYTQNIRLKSWSSTLPRIGLSHAMGKLFPGPKAPRNIRGAVAPVESEPPWYRNFGWTYRMEYANELALPQTFREEGLYLPPVLLNGASQNPIPIKGNDSLTVYQRDGMRHSGEINATARVLKYISLSPSLSITSVMTRSEVNYRVEDKKLDREDKRGLFTRTTFNLGTSASTTLYGLMKEPLGIGAIFRHQMKPEVGFRYTPNFGDKKWGYYKTVTMPDGRSYTYDRFQASEMASVVGGTPRGLSELFSFGLNHLFQMKTGNADDGTEKKYDLLYVTNSTGWDLAKDSLRWSSVNSSFRTSIPGKLIGPIQGLSLDLATTHSVYQRDGNTYQNKFYWDRSNAKWYAPLELLNAAVNVNFTMRAESLGELIGISAPVIKSATDDSTAVAVPDSLTLPLNIIERAYNPTPDLPPPPSGGKTDTNTKGPSELYQMPLSMQVNLRRNKDYISRTSYSSVGMSANFRLTPLYTFDMNYGMDLDRKQITDVHISATRQLHCWEASFTWSPMGPRPGYFLKISLKAPQLKDIKVERQRGAGFGGYN